MKKKLLILSLVAVFSAACGNSAQTSIQNQPNNVNAPANKPNDSLTVSSHSQNKPATASVPATSTNPKQENASPMARAVDVEKMTEDIEKAKAAYDKNQKSDEAKNTLAKAYFERAFALTDAAQYRAAMGDFRKGLKLDPNNAEAEKMYGEIIRIFQSIGREPPKEGDEPPPMPINK